VKINDFHILDIGTGSGEIGSFFADNNNVVGADVDYALSDKSIEMGLKFAKMDGYAVPHKEESFDIVISNYVIEHLEDAEAHLCEIYRLLKIGGICYLAGPNRLWPKEPHTKTWLLHYLPPPIFFKLLKLLGKQEGQIYLPNYWTYKRLFKVSCYEYKEYTQEVINNPDKYNSDERVPFRIPKWAQFLSKSNIFILKK